MSKPSISEIIAAQRTKQIAAAPPATAVQIDYYDNAEAREARATTTLSEIIAAIQVGEFAGPMNKVRTLCAAGDTKGAGIAKKALPAVSLSGCVTGLRKAAVADGRFTHSGLLQVDIDGKDNPDLTLDQIRQVLLDDQRIVAGFISPSGNGIKGIARIRPDAEQHKASYLAVERHFASIGIVIDKSCKDPVRLCFLSYDEGAWIDETRTQCFEPLPPGAEIALELDSRRRAEVSTDWQAPSPTRVRRASSTLTADGRMLLHDTSITLSIDDLREMIDCIPRPAYQEWIEICSAAWNTFGMDATEILQGAWPEVEEGEYAKKFTNRLQDFKQGTLWHHAQAAGWKPGKSLREQLDAAADVAAALTPPPPATTGSTMQSFAPGDLYYDGPTGKYLLQVGRAFHTFSRKSPIVTGITRHLAPSYDDAKDLRNAVAASIASREIDGSVQWSGSIAGHKIGRTSDSSGLPILITSEPVQPPPLPGAFPTLDRIISDAFPNDTALEVFMGWLSSRYKSVLAAKHVPAPMLVIAGEVNSGKSLLAWIVGEMLGGRSANPWAAWSGSILWNDDLVGAELLLIDDCAGNPDIRARRAFGAAFKEAMYPHAVQLRKRHQTSVSVRPVWSVLVCCNDTPEALNVIPPLDPDVSDKIALLHVSKVNIPSDTSTAYGRDQFQRLLKSEMSAFAQALVEWEVPIELRDSRSGIVAWRDPDLLGKVDATSPEKALLELLRITTDLAGNRFDIWNDLPCEMSSIEVQARLVQSSSIVKTQAHQLLSYSSACGIYLQKLARIPDSGITIVKKKNNANQYRIDL
jgi:hypothetical protein